MSDDDFDSTIRFPETAKEIQSIVVPPSFPKSSTKIINPFRKLVARGQSFGLLEELNEFISIGLKNIPKYDDSTTVDDLEKTDKAISHHLMKLRVYQESFDKFIEHFTKYRPLLTTIKREYDEGVKKMFEIYQDSLKFQSEKHIILSSHEEETKRIKDNFDFQIKEWEVVKQDMNDRIASLESKICMMNNEKNERMKQFDKLSKDLEDSRKSNVVLTTALNRYEDERRKLQLRETTRDDIESKLKSSEQRLLTEIERLQKVIIDLETKQEKLISQDILTNMQKTVSILKEDEQILKERHKKLVERYISLKTAIDTDIASSNTINSEVIKLLDDSIPNDKEIKILKDKGLLNGRHIIERLLTKIDELNGQIGKSSCFVDSSLNISSRFNSDNKEPENDEYMPWSHFHGRGDDLMIPPYLRTPPNTFIRNLRLTSYEAEALIYDIWKMKDIYDLDHLIKTNKTDFEKTVDMSKIIKQRVEINNNLMTSNSKPSQSKSSFVRSSKASSRNVISNNSRTSMKRSIGKMSRLIENCETIESTIPEVTPVAPMEYQCSNMESFLIHYLKQRFRNEKISLEVAYNLINALELYSSNSVCHLFHLILRNEIPEEIKNEIDQPLKRLKEELIAEEKRRNMLTVHDPNKLPYDSIVSVLKNVFNTKSSQEISEILQALDEDIPNKAIPIDYYLLLATTEQDISYPQQSRTSALSRGNSKSDCLEKSNGVQIYKQHIRSRLNEVIRTQFINNFKSQENEIRELIYGLIKNESIQGDNDSDNNEVREVSMESPKYVSMRVLRAALMIYDPHRQRSDMTLYLSTCYGIPIEEILIMEGKNIEVDIEDFIQRYRRNLLKKTLPRAISTTQVNDIRKEDTQITSIVNMESTDEIPRLSD